MTTERPCACGRTTTHHTCDVCLDQLAALLSDMPWLDEQLTASRTRQHGANLAGSRSSGETPLPWDEGASKAERRLIEKLQHWSRRCTTHDVAHHSPYPGGPPADTITAYAEWLQWRVDGLAHHGFATSMLRSLQAVDAAARRIVLWKRAPRTFLGRCEGTLPAGDQPSQPCTGEVYADEGSDVGKCVICGRPYLTEGKRRALELELDDRLYPAGELARLATHLGLDLGYEQVRKRIGNWHARRRIRPASHLPDGTPLFRYGTVRDLLYADAAKRTK